MGSNPILSAIYHSNLCHHVPFPLVGLGLACNGQPWESADFDEEAKREDGPVITYHMNGKIESRGHYKDG